MDQITGLEHIGIAVKNLEDAILFYENKLGLKCYKIEVIEDQLVRTAFFDVGNVKIELLESTTANGPISKFIDKKGEGLHHIAFKVNNIATTIELLSQNDVNLINSQPTKGADNLDIFFAHPKSCIGVLTEFCASKNKQENDL